MRRPALQAASAADVTGCSAVSSFGLAIINHREMRIALYRDFFTLDNLVRHILITLMNIPGINKFFISTVRFFHFLDTKLKASHSALATGRRIESMTSVIDTNFDSFAYTLLRDMKFANKHCRY